MDSEKEVSRILLGQAKCPGSHEWVPCGASPCPLRSMSWSLREARTWGADPHTHPQHPPDGSAVGSAGCRPLPPGLGRWEKPCPRSRNSFPRSSPAVPRVLVSSAPGLRRSGSLGDPRAPRRPQKVGRGRDRPWGTAAQAHLPPRRVLWGHGAPSGLRAGPATRSKRLLLVARGERGGLLPSPRAGRAMSSWTAPRNMSICTTACRSSRGGWG